MKKLLVLLLAVLMVVGLFAGCGGNEPTVEPTTPDSTEPSSGGTTNPTGPNGDTPSNPGGDTEGQLTRADLQAAVAELAWDYYIKGDWVQYDSMDVNTRTDGQNEPLTRWMGGHTRLDHFASTTLENATEHDTLYSVCSDFVWDVYYYALGYPIMGSSLNASTWYLWQYGENPSDMMVVRWHTWAENTNSTETEDGYVTHDKCLTYDELYTYMANWEENLEAGDIIVWPGHAMLYIGNGYVLDCRGGKYSMATGTDAVESGGAIFATTMYDLFFDPEMINGEYVSYFYMENLKNRTTSGQFCILRPLDLLTVDDGDADPQNDVLNEEYELDLGLQKGNFSFDPNVIKTSGFTITDATYTRLKYPLMNINRTVDISAQGTAAKGDTITYTIEITNGTTDASYMDWLEKGGNNWPFIRYKNLVIEELVPENTELISAKGATIDGSKLRWEISLAGGQTKKLSYTVKVTGEIGDKIVNGGGWVGNIPSNTLTNTIGGQKLSIQAVKNMWDFYMAGRDVWNSNDGYKISAGVNEGTRFAERIYNETAGLDLQLPEVQELVDMLFTQTLIESKGGLGGYFNNEVSRYMYVLNKETADPSNQIYRDMIVDTYYGGVWVFSNPYTETPRTVEVRVDSLEPGDILVMANLQDTEYRGMAAEDRDVKAWKILVYLGNDNFAELTSEGRLNSRNGTIAVTSILTYDLFVVLRPSQVYDDINTDVPKHVGPAKDLTEEDMAYEFKLEVSDVLLNDELSKQLSELTTDGFKMQNGTFIGEVYLKLKIDVVTNGTNDASYATAMKNLFRDVASDSEAYRKYSHEYFVLPEPLEGYESLYEMLLYYGGPAVATKNELKSLSQLHPGDAIMTGLRGQRYYTVAIYQGNGKFLGHSQVLEGSVFGENYSWYILDFASDTEFLAWLSGPIQPDVYDHIFYEGYVVLRPSRAYDDINAMSLRDIATGPLTQEEKDRLAAITPADRSKVTWHMNETAPWMYKLAYVDIGAYLDKTCYRTMEQIFKMEDGKWTLPAVSPGPKYRAMLVADYYGGTEFATSRTFTAEDFEIGDLFCAYLLDKSGDFNRYYVGLYQGDGKFLFGLTSGELYVDKTTVFSETLATDFLGYYVLRPGQISEWEEPKPEPKPVLTNKLTEEQKNAIAALQPEDIENKGNLVNEIAPVIYKAAGIDVSTLFGTNPVTGKNLTNFWTGEALFKWEGKVRGERLSIDSEYVQKISYMLVGDYYGGTEFATSKTFKTADFEIGDLFVAYGPATDGSGNVYYTAVYQGDGKFLAIDQTGSSKGGAYVFKKDSTTVFSADIATKFKMYYVLRPGYVLEDWDVQELTETQKAAISGLQVSAIKNKVWTVNQFAPLVYSAAYIDVSDYFGTNPNDGVTLSNFGMFNAIFRYESSIGGYQVRPNNYKGYVDFAHDMLVDGYFGGTMFAEGDRKTDFVAADFKIGDLFVGWQFASDDASKKVYYTAVYQGNGVFLAADQRTGTTENGYAYVYGTDSTTVFSAEELKAFTAYYVLRPRQVITPENLIAPGTLTKKEQGTIAAITSEDIKNKVWTVNQFAPHVYNTAGIDVSAYFGTNPNDGTNLTNFGMFNAIFRYESSIGGYQVRPNNYRGYVDFAHDMLVDGYFGGTMFTEGDRKTDFVAADFKIGDLFVGWQFASDDASKKVYYTAVYQGDGVFLAADQRAGTTENSYAYVYGTDSTTVFSAEELAAFTAYYVLRPSQVVR